MDDQTLQYLDRPLTWRDLAERRKFFISTPDKKPAYGYDHPFVKATEGSASTVKAEGRYEVTNKTPTRHFTLKEGIQVIQANPNKGWRITFVQGNIAGDPDASTRQKGEAKKGDALFPVVNRIMVWDEDLVSPEYAKEKLNLTDSQYQQAVAWLKEQSAYLEEVGFNLSYKTLSGRGKHRFFRSQPDVPFMEGINHLSIEHPSKAAKVECWSHSYGGQRSIILGTQWYLNGEPMQIGRFPYDEPIPELSLELYEAIKERNWGTCVDWSKTETPSPDIDIPAEGIYEPTVNGAVARLMAYNPDEEEGVFPLFQVPVPDSVEKGVYIYQRDGRLSILETPAGQSRFRTVTQVQNTLYYQKLEDLGVKPSALKSWDGSVGAYEEFGRIERVIKSVPSAIETFRELKHFGIDGVPDFQDIPTARSFEFLNRVTYTPDYDHDPIMPFADGLRRLRDGSLVEKPELVARGITTTLAAVPFPYHPDEPLDPNNRLVKLGKELYDRNVEANGKEFLPLLLTGRNEGMWICLGQTKLGKSTTWESVLQGLMLAFVCKPGMFPDLWYSKPTKSDQFGKGPWAACNRAILMIDEFASNWDMDSLVLGGADANQIRDDVLRDMTTKVMDTIRETYTMPYVMPVRATYIAVCNKAPVLMMDGATERRIYGFNPPAVSPILAKVTDRSVFQHDLVRESFLQCLLADMRDCLTTWGVERPDITELPSIKAATDYVRQEIKNRNLEFQEGKEAKSTKAGRDKYRRERGDDLGMPAPPNDSPADIAKQDAALERKRQVEAELAQKPNNKKPLVEDAEVR